MTLDDELAELRKVHGEKAITAYKAIAAALLNRRETISFIIMLDGFFSVYGFEVTCAALRLHAERSRGMINRVQESKARLPR